MIKTLYLSFFLVFATIAGIWSFTANRFRVDECYMIILAGGAVGLGVAQIIQAINGMLNSKKIE